MSSKADNPSQTLIRVAQAAAAAGVSKQTIDYYIMLGLVEPIRPAGKTGRYFDSKLIRRIQLINRLNKSGYTLQAIRETYLKDK